VFISSTTDPEVLFDLGDGEELPVVVVLVVQRTRPLTSDKIMLELLVRTSKGAEEEMAGVARFATHTTVNRGMLLYHMPR
jgi:hypothetical protein